MTSIQQHQHVTDARSNLNDQLAYAARIIGRSKDRLKVFEAVYFGRSKQKTATEIAKARNMARKRVLEEGVKLRKAKIVGQEIVDGDVAYIKDDVYANHKDEVISLVKNPQKLKALPTKTHPRVSVRGFERIAFPKALVKITEITVDDIASFKKVRKVKPASVALVPMAEKKFKEGIKKILGERGQHKDWGGEVSDLPTDRLILKTKRVRASFAFKGKGKKVKRLMPKDMGKNGDQIQRLFRIPADIHIVQYWGQIDESIVEQMRSFATAASVQQGKRIHFGAIDGIDSARLIKAYPEAFKK